MTIGIGGAALSPTESAAIIAIALDGYILADWQMLDATLSGQAIATVPSRTGSLGLTPGGDERWNILSIRHGRKYASPIGSGQGLLNESVGTMIMKHAFVVAEAPLTLPTSGNVGLLRTGGTTGDASALLLSSSSTWYTDGGWTHKCDGVATDVPGTGWHVYECSKQSNAIAGLAIGSWVSGVVYPTGIMRVIVCAEVPSAHACAVVLATLRRMYRI